MYRDSYWDWRMCGFFLGGMFGWLTVLNVCVWGNANFLGQ